MFKKGSLKTITEKEQEKNGRCSLSSQVFVHFMLIDQNGKIVEKK